MKIENIRAVRGPNVFSHCPFLVMRLDLGDLAGKESYEIPAFIDQLLPALPRVREHYCAKGRTCGFVQRLNKRTYFGHIAEHVCLELTDRVYDVAQVIELVRADKLGPNTKAIVDSAEERGIPWIRFGEGSLIQLGQGIHRSSSRQP